MTVLTRLLGATPVSPKTLTEKVAALESLSGDALASIALGDDEEALRVAAVSKLPAGDPLIKLAGSPQAGGDAGGVARAAQHRIAHLIDAGELAFDDFTRTVADPGVRMAVAAQCGEPSLLQQAIASVLDEGVLVRLAIEAPSTRMRQVASEAIVDPAHLRQVLKEVRAKDKNVYKIVKGKLDALHAQEKAVGETQAAIAAICGALERHIHHPLDNLFVPTLDHLQSQWNALAGQAADEIKLRADLAIDRCRQIVAQHQHKLAGEAARAAAVSRADSDRQAILDELRTMLMQAFAATAQDAERHLAHVTSRWLEIAARKSPAKDERARFEQFSNAVVSVSQFVAKHGSLSALAQSLADPNANFDIQSIKRTLNYAALLGADAPDSVAEVTAAVQSWETARANKQSAETHAQQQVSGLIRKALGALNAGNSRQAAGLRRAIEEKMHSLAHTPAHVAAQLHSLDEKLSVLKDWRSYAVAPKRQELIEQMEALVGTKEKPQALAEQIKSLQEEWKTVNKGAADHAEAEWQRFHEAAQKAYEPCREFFAGQAKMRAANLEKRKALLARISDFIATHNWEQPDWREAARALRESRQIWRAHHQVDAAANKPVQAQFNAALADLEQRLEGESAKNAAEKKRLIARAQHLSTLDDTRKAIDEVKRLQSAWKEVGIVAQDESQALWEEFRKHCDAVFAKKQAQFTEQRAALDATRSKALELCAEVDKLAALVGAELTEGAKKLGSLRDAFEALGELPKANARELNQRFDRAVQRVQAAVAQQRTRDKAAAWDRVLEAGDKIRRFRLAVAHDLPNEEAESRRQAAQAFVDNGSQWPKGALQSLKSELAKTGSTDLSANDKALRTLCIRAEILTETPTPSSDQPFRRAYQLQQLMQGMGYAARSGAEEIEAMILEWIAAGPVDDAAYAELSTRFNACRAKATATK